MAATQRDRSYAAQKRRERLLRANPLCVHCQQEGRYSAATELDHITPLWAGGADREDNLQGLCADHHRAKTAVEAKQRATTGMAAATSLGWDGG